jgi:hypothetical protein
MRGKNTIIINGKLYDAVSGLPMGAPDGAARSVAGQSTAKTVQRPTRTFSDIGPGAVLHRAAAAAREVKPSASVHQSVKKSTTLRRDVLKKPAASAHHLGAQRHKPAAGHVARSQMISKFAPHPQPIQKSATDTPTKHTEKPLAVSSHVARAHHLVQKPAPTTPQLSSRALKEKLIAEKLAETKKTDTKKQSFFSRQPRALGIVTGCLALIILGGYMTYLNMPNLSVRVAAAQAGVAAKFPDYKPDGYRFDGPITYTSGEVAIRFAANGGQGGYVIHEQTSSWDSQAVYDNLVAKESDGSHITNSQGGLTVYTYENNAAWVNGGILYTVEGDAPLSNEQLLKIAGSM